MGPKISNYESYYSGSQQCGGYFSLDNYLVKLMSDQRHALFKKMVHQPRASRPSCGNIKRFIKSSSSSALPHRHSLQKFYKVVYFSLDVCSIFPEVPCVSWQLAFPLCSSQSSLWVLLPTRALSNWHHLHSEPSGREGKMTHPQGNKECIWYLSSPYFPWFWVAVLFITSFFLERN